MPYRPRKKGLTGEGLYSSIGRTIPVFTCIQMEAVMADLSKEDIQALGRAVGLDIQEPELTEVMYSLNALLESLDAINPPGLDEVEPLPIILPPA